MLKRSIWLSLILLSIATACRQNTERQESTADSVQTSPVSSATGEYANPVLPGDYPDPSVTKVGDTYWATATSSEWAPLFPLLKSTDLVHWETVGHVFPNGLPDWADANFWAPEIAYENGKTYIYYTAHKKGGNLCVGVASADTPEGPYTDHGPLVCQDAGSIDGFPIRDENGQLYLVWKEDGNSRDLPTPIWGQRMNEERTALLGEKFELFRNDPKSWEGRLVEGPSIIRRGDYFYAFYAGDACCGTGCTYAEGVARARSLKGPWEKYSKNPVLTKSDDWKCPGHGTVISQNGRYYLLYHAYNNDSFVYPGRQGLLSEFTWNQEGWPEFKPVSTDPETAANGKGVPVEDEFTEDSLALGWQWPVSQKPQFKFVEDGNGQISLSARPEKIGAVLGQRTTMGDYTATAAIDPKSIQPGESAGLAAVGDPDNALGVWLKNGQVSLWQTRNNKTETITQQPLSGDQPVQLRMTTQEGHLYRFAYSTDGQNWQELNADKPLDGSYLPPWDRGIRAALLAKGPAGSAVQFDWFRLTNQ